MSDLNARRRARRAGKTQAVWIDIACNDPDNGIFAHRADMIVVSAPQGEMALELAARRRRPPRLVELPDARDTLALRLAGRRWPILASKYGVGNWCWNGYAFELWQAALFLDWLKGRCLFSADSGWRNLFEWWRGERDYDARAIHQLLHFARRPLA